MKGVILAAGKGSRLAPYTGSCPKPLLPVRGKPLIEYTINSLVNAGVTELFVVAGYGAGQLKNWLSDNGKRYGTRMQYVYNPYYELGNSYSLYYVRDLVGDEDFVASMADHLLSVESVLPLLAHSSGEDLFVGIDYAAQDTEGEATRVWVDEEGRVRQIGKGLARWNGIDAGVFRLSPAVFHAIDDAMAEGGDSLSDGLTVFIRDGGSLRACDISGAFWMDVDTFADWQRAEAMMCEL